FVQRNLQFSYDTSGAVPVFTPVNPTLANDTSRYAANVHREERYGLDETRWDGQLNLKFNSDVEDRGFGAAIGGRITTVRRKATFARTNYSNLGYTLADVTDGATLCGYRCDTPIPQIDPALVDAAFSAATGATAAIDAAAQAGGTYTNREDVYAAYAQAQYRADNWYVVAGLRMEHTDAGSSGTRATNGVYAPIAAGTTYTNWLPSALLVVDTMANGKLRLGVSETVSRPSFLSSSVAGGVLNTTASPPTLTTGNPALKPRRAWNLDIGHDCFGALQTVDGVDQQVLVTQARNTDDQVRVYGIELGASYNLTFLPAPLDGLGISGNATFSRANFPLTLSDGSTRALDALPQGIVFLDAEGRYLHWNEEYARIYHRSADLLQRG
ncbi:hypothetical protein LTR94_027226, partial [Friedmanniomyces endolithicus]